ncbi:hypothetical protein [Edaphovirga cremea]|uniref:hypothetical protein n=1 Tax=Edaphovirga cremea TaxID=2267246 RepID=UPI0039896D97
MIKNISEKEYKELADAAEGQTLDAVLCYSVPENVPAGFSFDERCPEGRYGFYKMVSLGGHNY